MVVDDDDRWRICQDRPLAAAPPLVDRVAVDRTLMGELTAEHMVLRVGRHDTELFLQFLLLFDCPGRSEPLRTRDEPGAAPALCAHASHSGLGKRSRLPTPRGMPERMTPRREANPRHMGRSPPARGHLGRHPLRHGLAAYSTASRALSRACCHCHRQRAASRRWWLVGAAAP